MNNLNSFIVEGTVCTEPINFKFWGDIPSIQFNIVSVLIDKVADPGSTIEKERETRSFFPVHAHGKLAEKLQEELRLDDRVRVIGKVLAREGMPIIVIADHVELQAPRR